MKKVLIYWFSFLIILLIMTSCKSTQEPVIIEKIRVEKVKETIRDTIIEVVADSSAYKALLECQDGKVVLKKELEKKAGKNLKEPKVNLDDKGVLQVDCETEIQYLKAKLKDKETRIENSIEVPIYIQTPLSWWQMAQIWLGRLFLLIILGLVIGFFLKK